MSASRRTSDVERVRSAVAGGVPRRVDQLSELVRIASIAGPDHAEALTHSANAIAHLFRETRFFDAVRVVAGHRGDGLPGGPAVIGTRAARAGAPTVLLYAHHDVQPAEPEGWTSPPFDPVLREGRLYGRGSADDKGGVIVHLTSLELLRDLRPDSPLGVVVLIEGEEEEGSPTFSDVLGHVDAERVSAIVIADSDNRSDTVPALVHSLRGQINLFLTVSTLDEAVHAGANGGGYPDAMIPMARLLASFHHADGSVAVAGLQLGGDPSTNIEDTEHRSAAGVLDGVEPLGTESLSARLWRRPSITITGMTLPDVRSAPTVLLPEVTAKVTVRVAPEQPIAEAWESLRAHIAEHTAFGAHVRIDDGGVARGVMTNLDHPAAQLMLEALQDGWGEQPESIGSGGSIALVAGLAERFPDAAILMAGIIDPASRPHGADESVSLAVLQKSIVAETLFLLRMDEDSV